MAGGNGKTKPKNTTLKTSETKLKQKPEAKPESKK